MWVRQKFGDLRLTAREVEPLQWFFLVAAAASALTGHFLQQQAFPISAPSPFAQVSVSVYTRINPSRVLLKASIAPNASQQDRLDITVKGPHGRPDPWLLVITCPRPVPGRVGMQLIGVTPPQATDVLASTYNVDHRSVPLRCVGAAGGQPGGTPAVLAGEDINLSLPALEQSPVGQSAAADTPLYVVRGTSGSRLIEKVVEVFQAPQSSCPYPGASLAPSPAVSVAATSAPYASPTTGSAAGTPGTACYTGLPAGAIATKYSIPTSVTTSETLQNVSLSGDRIDSMFPPGQITSDNRIIWQGVSGLSPSLSATSLTGAAKATRDGFYAGLLYGLAAGLIVPFLQGVSDARDKVRDAQERTQNRAARQISG